MRKMTMMILMPIFILLVLQSCGDMGGDWDVQPPSYSTLPSSSDQPAETAFSTELDDPATRGSVTRVTPELTAVTGYVDMSSDGRYLYYAGYLYAGSTHSELWKLDLDGKHLPIRLTSGEGRNKQLSSWQPSLTNDDAFVMYSSGNHIWRIKTDGTGGRISFPGVGSSDEWYPKVSIDNKVSFSVTSTNGRNEVWVSNVDGTDLTFIREGHSADWSPNGETLVFVYNADIWTVNLDGTNLIQMTNTPDIREYAPSYSHDGGQVFFSSNQDKEDSYLTDVEGEWPSFNLWSMNIDGTTLTQETELDAWDAYPYQSHDALYFLSGRGNREDWDNEIDQYTRIWKVK